MRLPQVCTIILLLSLCAFGQSTCSGFSVDAGEDVAIEAGDAAQLTVTTTGGASPFVYGWTPASGVVGDSGARTVTAQPSVTTTYTAAVTDAAGCIAFDSALVFVLSAPAEKQLVSITATLQEQHGGESGNESFVVQWLGQLLNIPAVSIEITSYAQGSTTRTFTMSFNLNQVGVRSASALASQLLIDYGGDINDLPFAVPATNALMQVTRFSALTFNGFAAPYAAPEPFAPVSPNYRPDRPTFTSTEETVYKLPSSLFFNTPDSFYSKYNLLTQDPYMPYVLYYSDLVAQGSHARPAPNEHFGDEDSDASSAETPPPPSDDANAVVVSRWMTILVVVVLMVFVWL